jgi:serine/threonine-protein kinase
MGDNLSHLPHVPRIELTKPGRHSPAPKATRDEKVFSEDLELKQRIKILRKIADGGMGSVYLADWRGSAGFSKTVAVKVIKPEKLHDERGIEMFTEEAKLVADLVHPNICQVYTLERHKGEFFIVMEYIHGLGLDRLSKAHSDKSLVLPIEYSAFIASRVCRGLDYAHKKHGRDGKPLGIVHRDVTPGNILVAWCGSIELGDFGIAKAVTNRALAEKRVLTGKLNYMSPEQSRAEPVDARSDIYSLGLCLHEILTGQPVYNAKTIKELYEQQKRGIREPLMLNEHVPKELSNICMKALKLEPDARFGSAKEFGDQLEYFMYRDKWGPTNEKLANYLHEFFPEINRDRIV